MISSYLRALVGLLVTSQDPPKRSERGLSQSAEIAILIGAAATAALLILAFIVPYVTRHLPT